VKTKYRLNQTDMAYQEEHDLRAAKRYGMTRTEYMEARLNLNNDVRQYCVFVPYRRDEDLKKLYKCFKNFEYKHGLFTKPVTQ